RSDQVAVAESNTPTPARPLPPQFPTRGVEASPARFETVGTERSSNCSSRSGEICFVIVCSSVRGDPVRAPARGGTRPRTSGLELAFTGSPAVVCACQESGHAEGADNGLPWRGHGVVAWINVERRRARPLPQEHRESWECANAKAGFVLGALG